MKFAKLLEALCFLAWFLIVILIDAVLNAWAMSELWRWFAAPQYGAGPQIGAWFGITIVARLMLHGEADEERMLRRLQDDDAPSLWGMIKKSLWNWGNVLFMLGVAWCLGSALHWIR